METIKVIWENPETETEEAYQINITNYYCGDSGKTSGPPEECYPPEPEEIEWEPATGVLLTDLAILANEELCEHIEEQCLYYMRQYNNEYCDPPEEHNWRDDYYNQRWY